MSNVSPSPSPSSSASGRRRRSDARQNTAAILDAASRVLTAQPDAGLVEVAKAAGVSRQTVYAHFPSRDALVGALIERATERVLAALAAADLESGPADQALVRLLEVAWASFDADPFLLHLAAPPATAQEDRDRHRPIMRQLTALIERGQAQGDIDPGLETGWIMASFLALGHAAGEEVRAGRMTSQDAVEALRVSIPRLVRPDARPSKE